MAFYCHTAGKNKHTAQCSQTEASRKTQTTRQRYDPSTDDTHRKVTILTYVLGTLVFWRQGSLLGDAPFPLKFLNAQKQFVKLCQRYC